LSIHKKVKEVLRKKEVLNFEVTYVGGSTKKFDLAEDPSKKAVKKALSSINWDSVAEVNFEVTREDDDEDD